MAPEYNSSRHDFRIAIFIGNHFSFVVILNWAMVHIIYESPTRRIDVRCPHGCTDCIMVIELAFRSTDAEIDKERRIITLHTEHRRVALVLFAIVFFEADVSRILGI